MEIWKRLIGIVKKLPNVLVPCLLIIVLILAAREVIVKTYSFEVKKVLLVKALEKKYDKEFVVDSGSPADILKGYDEFAVYPKGGDKIKEMFLVIPYYYFGNIYFQDNYFGLLIKDEYKKVVQDELDKEYKNYRLMVETVRHATLSVPLDGNTTLNQINDKEIKWARWHGQSIDDDLVVFSPKITVRLSKSSLEEKDVESSLMRFISAMAKKKLVCSIDLFVYSDDYFIDFENHQGDWEIRYSTGINGNDLSMRKFNINNRMVN